MRIVMNMRWAGVTPEQYEKVRSIVRWEENVPPGGVFHVASFDRQGLRVTDIWESEKDMNTFVETQLMPGVVQSGITTQPQVEVSQFHRTFVPALIRG